MAHINYLKKNLLHKSKLKQLRLWSTTSSKSRLKIIWLSKTYWLPCAYILWSTKNKWAKSFYRSSVCCNLSFFCTYQYTWSSKGASLWLGGSVKKKLNWEYLEWPEMNIPRWEVLRPFYKHFSMKFELNILAPKLIRQYKNTSGYDTGPMVS